MGSKYIFTYNALDQTGYASPIDTILLTQKAGNNAIDHSQGETGVGMWKYAVGGGIHGQGRGGAKENAYSAFL